MAQKVGRFVTYVDLFTNESEKKAENKTAVGDRSNSNNNSVSKCDLINNGNQVDTSAELSVDCNSEPSDNTQCVSDSLQLHGIKVSECTNDSSLLQSPTVGDEKLTGYLQVCASGERTLLRQSRKRWFVFDSNVCKLLFFRSAEDCALVGGIDISMATFSLDAKQPTVFEIRSEGTVHYLEAYSRQSATEWVKGLQNARRTYCRKKANQAFTQLLGRSVQQPEGGLLYEERSGHQVDLGKSDESGNLLDAKAQVMQIGEADICDGPSIADAVTWKSELKSFFTIKKSRSVSSGLQTSMSGGSETSDDDFKMADKGGSNSSTMGKLRNFLDHSVFQRASCSSCQQLQKRLLFSEKEREGVEDEILVLKEVKRVLQRELNLAQREKETMQYVGSGVLDSDLVALLQEKEREAGSLAGQLNQLEEEFAANQAEKKGLAAEVARMRVQVVALEESLASCDDQRVSLKYQISNLEAEVEMLKDAVQKSRVRRSDANMSELQTLKDLCRGYEQQNRMLNQEVLELQRLRVEEERDKNNLLMKCMQLEAEKCKMETKYIRLLQDLQTEGQSSYNHEMVCQLLKDAIDWADEDEQLPRQQRGPLYDRFGFAIKPWDCNAMEVSSATLSRTESIKNEVEELPREISSVHRWENFLVVTGDRSLPRGQELKALLRQGVPAQFKERVWKACVGFHTSHLVERMDAGYYANLLQSVDRNSLDPTNKQIELDLLRTLPRNRFYESVDSAGIAKLRNVLLAYSARNPSLGYCQGLNRLAAIALLFLSEEDAFWCLVAIVDRLMPASYYQQSLAGAHVDQRVLKDLVSIKLPRLHAHLEQHSVDLSMFTFSWFLTVFVDETPVSTYLRIWDAFLFEGNKILFRFALAFLKEAESELLALTDSLSIHCALRLLGQRMTNANRVADVAYQGMNPFPMRTIQQKRQIYRAQVMDELQKLSVMRRQASFARQASSPMLDTTLSDED